MAAGGVADLSGRAHRSLEEALRTTKDWTKFPEAGCGCTFGVCTRLDAIAGDRDWYEPNEPALEQDGLPWFYFIPSVDGLAPELHEQYLEESGAWWGEDPAEE